MESGSVNDRPHAGYSRVPARHEQLYAHSGILPFNLLVKHRVGLLMYKLSNGNVPKPLLNMYKSNKDIHTDFTRQANHFCSRRGNTEFVYRTFAFQNVFIWNKIIHILV